MNAQMLMPLASIIIIRSLDTEDPSVQNNILYAFVATQALILMVGLLMYIKISASGDTSVVDVPAQKVPFTGAEQSPARQVRACDYDKEQFNELFLKRMLLTAAITTVLWWKWAHVVPLLFQCLHNPLQIYQSPLFKIYVLGHSARGSLARPFPQVSPFGMLGDQATGRRRD